MLWSRLALVLLLFAAGCGYRPLYAQRGVEGGTVSNELAAIKINAIPDRIGQQLYNMLRDGLTPQGKPEKPIYVLSVSLSETNERLFYEEDETATRSNLTLRATYTLARIDNGQIVTQGLSRAQTSYDILAANVAFATVTSEDDARVRSARAISDDVRARLALALAARDAAKPQ
jgi:LPS-assembly lipoprotein